MNEENTPQKLNDAVRAFQEAGIDFVVIGGLAMVAHGSSYITRDVDVAYSIDNDNLKRLATFLSAINSRLLGGSTSDQIVITITALQRVKFLNLFTDLGEIDVMREIAGIESFAGLWERAVTMDMGGFTVRVASLDDLIAMKRAANRPKDRLHLLELMQLKALHAEGEIPGDGPAPFV